MFQLKKTFEDILDNAYPDDENLSDYKKVYVETLNETRKSFHGDYNRVKKKIRIFNLYRSDAALVATSIHELSHHVDNCKRNTTDHGPEFYAIYKTLLYTALNMGIFTKEEFMESTRDASDTNKIKDMLSHYEPKSIVYKNDMIIISAKNGYEQKEYLKDHGYKWNGALKTWDKEIPAENASDEQDHLKSVGIDSCIRDAKRLVLSKGMHIIAKKGSYDIKDILKSEGFLFDTNKKHWAKQGSEAEYKEYIKRFPDVDWTMS